MACRKCGSSWTTSKGKDKVSCPECCKQQRCKARRQGNLPATAAKTCERCGAEFEAANATEVTRSRHCLACRVEARKEWMTKYRAKVSAGTLVPAVQQQTLEKQCGWCNAKTRRPNHKKYCSRACFMAARKAGVQSWDRTRQHESVWHRGGIWACAPSRKPVLQMLNNMTLFLAKVAKAYAQASKKEKACEVCGEACYGFRARFCSVACLAKSQRAVSCYQCGAPCQVHGVHIKKLCIYCSRVAKNKYGRKHRSRARYYGVKYVRFRLRDIYERDAYTCQLCSKRVYEKPRYRKSDGKIHPRSPSIDHIVPLSRGGNHEPHNCQTACFICNSRKGAMGGGQLRLAMS
jgi:5-methylcytosine-specific restriction endonuclease McrA